MNEQIDLEQIERQVFLSFHQDGFLDLCLGGALLQLGIISFVFPSIFSIFLGSTSLWIFIFMALKNAITIPRLGYAEFSVTRQNRNVYLILLLVVILLAPIVGMVVGLLVIPNFMPILLSNYRLILAFSGVVAFCVIAYSTGIRRFYAYGVLIGVSFSLCHFWFLPLFLPLLVTGGLLLLMGLVLSIRFLRRYPKTDLTERKVNENG